ncbi:uncharacterized protein OCT59_015317 [Rhizophagus irregularis]|uniref:uncharacterized protein n=1 Tax=Rhizophagus irregularis TaxID=588596 RepID=UPI000CAF17BA|nr:hypothetical protein OCT59_015317 [Rhizophagus irregularis]GBC18807.1 hypothetical protein GLOIN_2v1499113 [Rhizophagus irregularis DAOM 181602=DAOM 197198]CAB4463174.1 unnamed protein product [Rhizophagus irregularis]
MYSEKNIIEMAESYTCLRLDNRYVFQVEVYKKDNKIFFELGDKEIQFEKLKVGQLVEIISRKGKFEDSDRLNLWKVDVSKSRIGSTEDEIRELGGVSMEPECNFKKYFEADYGPTENNIHIIAVIQTTYTGKRNLDDSDDRKRKRHRTFAPSNRVHDDINYFIEPKEAVERLGNFLRDGKFCLLCGHRQSGKTTTAYAIEEWLLTNCDKDVYVMNLNNGIVINDGPEKFWWSICCQLESLDKNRFSFDKLDEASYICGNDGDETIIQSFIGVLRSLKDGRRNQFGLYSILLVGTELIKEFLKNHQRAGSASIISPFSAETCLTSTRFTRAEIQELLHQ